MLDTLVATASEAGVLGSDPFSVILVGFLAVLLGTAAMGVLGSRRPSGFPPGPTPIPFLGNITAIRKKGQTLWVTMGDLGREYGNIFSIKLGDKWYVVLNSYEAIRDGMLTRPEALADRPHYYSTEIFSDDYRDLGYTNYSPTWLLHRQFAQGVSSSTNQNQAVNVQFDRYVEPFIAASTAEGERSVDGIELGKLLSMGSIVTWCFGPDDEALHRDLVEVVSVEVSANLVGSRLAADILPILRYLPLKSNQTMEDVVGRFMTILRTEFDLRRKVFNEDSEISDLCAALIRAQKTAENDKKYDFLTDVHVVQVLASSFRGAIGLLTTTYWGLALLAEYPDVQLKVANEIRDVIGRDSQPSVGEHQDAMPYTMATVFEMLRFGSVAPLGVPRAAHHDINIGGFHIPKSTVILYNIYATHFDEANFADPHEFKPERYLNSDGSLISWPEKLIPYGLGMRKCLGYKEATAVLFLAFSRLLQRYRLAKVDGAGTPGDGGLLSQDPAYEGSRSPAPFRIKVMETR